MAQNPANHETTEFILTKFKERFRISEKGSVDLLTAFTNFLGRFEFPLEPSKVTIKANTPKYGYVQSDLFVDKQKVYWLSLECERAINSKTLGFLREYTKILNEMHSNRILDLDKIAAWWEGRYYIQTPYFEWSESATHEYFVNTPPFIGMKVLLVFPWGQRQDDIEYIITPIIDYTKQKRIVPNYKHEWGGPSFWRNGKNCKNGSTGKIRLIPFNNLIGSIASIQVNDSLDANIQIRLTKEQLKDLRNYNPLDQSPHGIYVTRIPFWEPMQNNQADDEVKIVENGIVTNYQAFLFEPYRPPSKGGNTSALHSHVLWIDGVKYTFLARGSKQWVYDGDTVTFAYKVKDGKYNNIVPESLFTIDEKGEAHCRGDRRHKNPLRTATYKR